jgi:surface protein
VFYENLRFENCDINNWDVSSVTTMRAMFYRAEDFHEKSCSLNAWDVSSVKDMHHMFEGPWLYGARKSQGYNGDISNWDVSSVTTMHKMFFQNKGFNQDLSAWNLHENVNARRMFENATSHTQTLRGAAWCRECLVAKNTLEIHAQHGIGSVQTIKFGTGHNIKVPPLGTTEVRFTICAGTYEITQFGAVDMDLTDSWSDNVILLWGGNKKTVTLVFGGHSTYIWKDHREDGVEGKFKVITCDGDAAEARKATTTPFASLDLECTKDQYPESMIFHGSDAKAVCHNEACKMANSWALPNSGGLPNGQACNCEVDYARNTGSSTGFASCTPCLTGSSKINRKMSRCHCDPGYEDTDYDWSVAQTTAFRYHGGKCKACPTGASYDASTFKCKCDGANSVWKNITQRLELGCEACPDGEIADAAQENCNKVCPPFTQPSQGGTSCICDPGLYYIDANDPFAGCTTCPLPGSHPTRDRSTCVCDAYRVLNNDGTACVYCDAGAEYDGGECVACPQGEFSTGFVEPAHKFLFQGSNYIYGENALLSTDVLQCQACPSGYTTIDDDRTACDYCPAGTMLDGTECQACASGKISRKGHSCAFCEAGTTANSDRTQCMCSEDQYSIAANYAGTSNVPGQTSNVDCRDCPTGWYRDAFIEGAEPHAYCFMDCPYGFKPTDTPSATDLYPGCECDVTPDSPACTNAQLRAQVEQCFLHQHATHPYRHYGWNSADPVCAGVSDWDVSILTNFDGVFQATDFNLPLRWDVSNAVSMVDMFKDSTFNQNINTWDVRKVVSMNNMFENAAFNQPIGDWTLDALETANSMFENNEVFNQNIKAWDVPQLTSATRMFMFADAFNQDLSPWTVAQADVDQIFHSIYGFTQTLCGDWTSKTNLFNAMTQGSLGGAADCDSCPAGSFKNAYSFQASGANGRHSNDVYLNDVKQASDFTMKAGLYDISMNTAYLTSTAQTTQPCVFGSSCTGTRLSTNVCNDDGCNFGWATRTFTQGTYHLFIDPFDDDYVVVTVEAECAAGDSDCYCTECPQDTFSSTSTYDKIPCDACPAGLFSEPGSTQCTQCAAGMYQTSTNGVLACVECGLDTFVSDERHTKTACDACASGRYAPVGSTACAHCTAGKFKDGDVCTNCAKHTYTDVERHTLTSCKDCLHGEYAAEGSAACNTDPFADLSDPTTRTSSLSLSDCRGTAGGCAMVDACGVCGGDGTSCSEVGGKTQYLKWLSGYDTAQWDGTYFRHDLTQSRAYDPFYWEDYGDYNGQHVWRLNVYLCSNVDLQNTPAATIQTGLGACDQYDDDGIKNCGNRNYPIEFKIRNGGSLGGQCPEGFYEAHSLYSPWRLYWLSDYGKDDAATHKEDIFQDFVAMNAMYSNSHVSAFQTSDYAYIRFDRWVFTYDSTTYDVTVDLFSRTSGSSGRRMSLKAINPTTVTTKTAYLKWLSGYDTVQWDDDWEEFTESRSKNQIFWEDVGDYNGQHIWQLNAYLCSNVDIQNTPAATIQTGLGACDQYDDDGIKNCGNRNYPIEFKIRSADGQCPEGFFQAHSYAPYKVIWLSDYGKADAATHKEDIWQAFVSSVGTAIYTKSHVSTFPTSDYVYLRFDRWVFTYDSTTYDATVDLFSRTSGSSGRKMSMEAINPTTPPTNPCADGNCDCHGTLGGTAVLDQCYVCGGDNSCCTDCAGVVFGARFVDNCGVCTLTPCNIDVLYECKANQFTGDTCNDAAVWYTAGVTDMQRLFESATEFNQDIGNWDTSTVTAMQRMFYKASAFDQNIGAWDVSSVSDMSLMFYHAPAFNQNLNGWDVSRVTDMASMFWGASAFDGDLSAWDVSQVTTMSGMFAKTAFNQDISAWNTAKVNKMHFMFHGANAFNQNIGGWETGEVTNMKWMFGAANGVHNFDKDLGGWDVSRVTDMYAMFYKSKFNQDIGDWTVTSLSNMDWMFGFNNAFNQDLDDWDVSNVQRMVHTFYYARAMSYPLGRWTLREDVQVHPNTFYVNAISRSDLCSPWHEAGVHGVPAGQVDNCNVCNGGGAHMGCDNVCFSGKVMGCDNVCTTTPVTMGCDNVCGSGKVSDACGVCEGDDSTCITLRLTDDNDGGGKVTLSQNGNTLATLELLANSGQLLVEEAVSVDMDTSLTVFYESTDRSATENTWTVLRNDEEVASYSPETNLQVSHTETICGVAGVVADACGVCGGDGSTCITLRLTDSYGDGGGKVTLRQQDVVLAAATLPQGTGYNELNRSVSVDTSLPVSVEYEATDGYSNENTWEIYRNNVLRGSGRGSGGMGNTYTETVNVFADQDLDGVPDTDDECDGYVNACGECKGSGNDAALSDDCALEIIQVRLKDIWGDGGGSLRVSLKTPTGSAQECPDCVGEAFDCDANCFSNSRYFEFPAYDLQTTYKSWEFTIVVLADTQYAIQYAPTDSYASENSWEIRYASGALLASGDHSVTPVDVDIPKNRCAENPCGDGVCSNTMNSFTCECEEPLYLSDGTCITCPTGQRRYNDACVDIATWRGHISTHADRKTRRHAWRTAVRMQRDERRTKRQNMPRFAVTRDDLSAPQQLVLDRHPTRTPVVTVATPQEESSTDIGDCHYDIADEVSTEKEILMPFAENHYAFVCVGDTFVARQQETADGTEIACWDGSNWGDANIVEANTVCNRVAIDIGSVTSSCTSDLPYCCDMCGDCDDDPTNDCVMNCDGSVGGGAVHTYCPFANKQALQAAVNICMNTGVWNHDIVPCNSVAHWDVSQVVDMSNLFKDKDTFNENIAGWNVGQVTDMSGMFQNAESFDQDLSHWNVRNDVSMDNMFNGAFEFNHLLCGQHWIDHTGTTVDMFEGSGENARLDPGDHADSDCVYDLNKWSASQLKQAYRSNNGCGNGGGVSAPDVYAQWNDDPKPTQEQIKSVFDAKSGCSI